MFENTLLIIKSDYMSRRKCLLLHLLSKGFLIQGNKKLAFTPEDAAEFYKELADDKCYMLYVILLSKGTSEAFILRKENAAEELLNIMICYFGTSVEMDRNVHVSRSNDAARSEITFIFPNYIHEPIPLFDKNRFCQQPLMAPFFGQVYDIMQAPNPDPETNWRTKLSNWLVQTNASIPEVSNQCSLRPQIGFLEKHQQTDPVYFKDDKLAAALSARSSSMSSSQGSSGVITSTSCVSCSSFEQEEQKTCPKQADLAEFEARLKERATKTLEEPHKVIEDEKLVCDEQTDLTYVYEYEDDVGSEEEGTVEAENIAEETGLETVNQQSAISVEHKEPDKTVAIDGEEDNTKMTTEAVEDLQIEQPTELAPPAEGEAEEKPNEDTEKPNEDIAPEIEQATEPEPAVKTEPVAEEVIEPNDTTKTEEPAAEEVIEPNDTTKAEEAPAG